MADRHTLNAFAALAARAATDDRFRARLVDDAHAAAHEAGVELSPSVRVRFIEKPDGLDHLVVLPDLAAAPAELTDAELDSVAGGCGAGTCLDARSEVIGCTASSTMTEL